MDIVNWKKILLPYEQAVDELCVKIKSLAREYILFDKHSPIEEVVGRVKSIGSIMEKANRKNIPYNEIQDKIEDIAGVRVICRFVEDIEKVVHLIKIRDGKDLFITEERDYVKNRKPSGYRSYHILLTYPIITKDGNINVKCEIQIRTLAMNFWATLEHSLKYKYNGNIPNELQKRLEASAEAAFNLDNEISTIRDEIMEAQKIIQLKNNLVDKILVKMKKLYCVIKLDDMNNLNKEFLNIYAEENLEKLQEFNNKLNIMAQLYQVHF